MSEASAQDTGSQNTGSKDSERQAFFEAWRRNFSETLAQAKGHAALADALASQACEALERNAALLSADQPLCDCKRGCDICCCLQVSASAPEIFHAAHFIRLTADAFAQHGVNFTQNLRDIQHDIAGKDQQARVATLLPCPFVIHGACAIYSARTLACRGHVAFDAQACKAAMLGEDVEVPISAAHRDLRHILQAALCAALGEARLPDGLYEFLGALDLALREPEAETRWRQGEDVFAAFRLGTGAGAAM